MSYRKRAKGNWNGGKSRKEYSNRQERQFEKTEISQAMQEYDEGESFRYLHRSKRTPNEKARLEARINWYEQMIEHYGDFDLLGYKWSDRLIECKEELEKKYGNLENNKDGASFIEGKG